MQLRNHLVEVLDTNTSKNFTSIEYNHIVDVLIADQTSNSSILTYLYSVILIMLLKIMILIIFGAVMSYC